MKKTIILFVLIALAIEANAKVLMQPYLQAVTNNSIYLLVETDSEKPVESFLEYPDGMRKTIKSIAFEVTDAKPATYVHSFKYINLHPATKYSYSMKDGDVTYKGSFNTAPNANARGKFKFTSYGDSRSAPKLFAKISKGMESENPDFSVYLGDLSFDGSYKLWKNEFFIPEQLSLAKNVPFFNAVGNHEGWKINTKAFTEAPISAGGNQEYYSFDYGDIHFLVLSTQNKIGEDSPQWKFAEEDLKNSKAKWKFVAFHIPAYGAGAHGESKGMIKMSEKIFEKQGVDVVLTGHSHFYQHNKVNKIHHFILGGGGSPLYSPKEAPYVIKSAKEYHYAIFDCTPNKIEMTVKNIDGKEIDKIVFEKE